MYSNAIDSDSAAVERPAAPGRRAASRPTRVFLVEDNPAIRQGIVLTLCEEDRFEIVGEAATRDEATRWLGENPGGWDLAVIDIFLTQGHGFDVLRACAGRAAHQKAVVLTNYTREPVRSSAARLGADAVFDKSLEMEAFVRYCAALAA